MARILVIDDDAAIRAILDYFLTDIGHHVACADSGEEGLRRFGGETFDLVILDFHLPGMQGSSACRSLKAIRPDLPVLMATGRPSAEVLRMAREAGANRILQKPFDLDELTAVLAELLPQRSPGD